MKKIFILLTLIILLMSISFAQEEVSIKIPEYDVKVNGVLIDTEHSQYPVISYKNITYFPMTSDYAKGIGLNISYKNSTGLEIVKGDRQGELEQLFLGKFNVLDSKHTASLPEFDIRLNGVLLDNNNEDYPILLFRNITYFPMTWRFAVTEFSWKTKWSSESGFEIIVPEVIVESTNPTATIEFEDNKEIVIELFPNVAPNTINNFIALAQANYYDGLIFHRVISDFMIQGGDPTGTGSGGPGYSIPAEFTYQEDGQTKTLSHVRGIISMARSSNPDSAGSQFFIVHKNASFLDGNYASFGKVIEGMDVLDEIATTPTVLDRPVDDVVIKTITINLKEYKTSDIIKSE